jgi:molecular chaperone GrpE
MAHEEDDRSSNQSASERADLKEANSENADGASVAGGEADLGASLETETEPSKGEGHSSRMNAAKAFYRAMYAGEEVQPDDFGMSKVSMKGRGEAPPSSGPCGNCQYLENQLAELEAKYNQIEAQSKRYAADFDNFRKRTEREREELLGLGIQRAVEALLPAIDDLDRAQSHFTEESTSRSIVESLKLIYNRTLKCLDQLGVTSMNVIGQPFDPKFHEPVQQIETNDWPEGSVVQDLRRGYLMKEKVVRPSLVNVAVAKGPESESPAVHHEHAIEVAAEAESEPVVEHELAQEPEGEAIQD